MRRALVLTNEGARHWFRASLPAHVFRVTAVRDEGVGTDLPKPANVMQFVQTYAACFIAVMLYIA